MEFCTGSSCYKILIKNHERIDYITINFKDFII